jgi:hypothetical protein
VPFPTNGSEFNTKIQTRLYLLLTSDLVLLFKSKGKRE